MLHRTGSRERRLSSETATSSIGTLLGTVTGNEMLDMPDWLLKRQSWIERSLANRHRKGGNTPILYDVCQCPLPDRGCVGHAAPDSSPVTSNGHFQMSLTAHCGGGDMHAVPGMMKQT
ncbi:MAG: hypothetical protein F4X97_11030 [Boseongicola sp. SB0662_bin_57]|nr:hypothetical protein [Boseongicola sp. SB0662_bin_57]